MFLTARDADEKERWISALQNTIERHSQPSAVSSEHTRWEWYVTLSGKRSLIPRENKAGFRRESHIQSYSTKCIHYRQLEMWPMYMLFELMQCSFNQHKSISMEIYRIILYKSTHVWHVCCDICCRGGRCVHHQHWMTSTKSWQNQIRICKSWLTKFRQVILYVLNRIEEYTQGGNSNFSYLDVWVYDRPIFKGLNDENCKLY